MRGYAFDNDSVQATAHHDALAELLDAGTRRRIEELIDLPGKRCLEVAAGGGSIAHWLAGRGAEVVATDLKPQHIAERPGLSVRAHDITSGEPLGRFDLVHARLLMNHLPRREVALRHMIDALEPGGVLLTEDFLPAPPAATVAYGPPRVAALVAGYLARQFRVLSSHGNDREWSRRALTAFHHAGLTGTDVRVHAAGWPGGGPGCRMLRAGLGQLRAEVTALGMTDAELTELADGLEDPALMLNGFLLYQTSGRKPV